MSGTRRKGMRVSDEASAEGLRLAREAGEAYQRMVAYFLREIADAGSTRDVGDYRIGVAVENAEPLWHACGSTLVLGAPPVTANQHLEVVVTDVADGRFIPELEVTATLLRGRGDPVGTWKLPFLWHPTMFHYGCNVAIPGSGTYALRVSIATPTFFRHDAVNGKRYAEPVVVEFTDLELSTGREEA